MPKIYARKQGNVCTVYIDTATNQSIPFTDFENPPQDIAFPQTMSEAELRATYRGYDIVMVEKPQAPEAPAAPRIPTAALLAGLQALGVSQALQDRAIGIKQELGHVPSAQGPTAALTAVGSVIEDSALLDKALLEYRMLVIRNLKDISKVFPVKKFIVKLWPEVNDKLAHIEQEEIDA